MARKYRYMRKDFGELEVKLNHLEISLNFFEDRVEVDNLLDMTARKPLDEVKLDARELKVIYVKTCTGPRDEGKEAKYSYDKEKARLTVKLERKVKKGERFYVRTSTHCFPNDKMFMGIYKDTTPKGAPQQYMSQCEMWGFQRIMPAIDDPRAKCTMRTTMEGDARYTHMISSGNICRKTNPDGRPVPKPGDKTRKVITYENDIPISPYLFIAIAGTWDELRDKITYDSGREVQLEYLVPRDKKKYARIPMDILKDSILWIRKKQDYEYKRDVYRTITMDKSFAGGMENTGNTTIVTDAAMIDEHTLDGFLLYAYKVIAHEFEHNQCGSDTTMETPFDMWLNEAYTVDVERQYSAERFDPDLMRLNQVDSLRGPLLGPLVMEDSGYGGRIVREGFNDPEELIDGVTYEKAPEVIRMLRLIIGKESFRKGKELYFSRYRDGNANTDQFFECFEEACGSSLEAFKRGWLYRPGYPKVKATTAFDEKKGTYTITFIQDTKGEPFHIPIELALVDERGKDIHGTSQLFHFDKKKADVTLRGVKERPAFASLNRDYSFYGTFMQEMSTEELEKQVLLDPNLFNRAEAMRTLTDIQRIRLMKNPEAGIDKHWLELVGRILEEKGLSPSLRSRLLLIGEDPLDRRYLAWYHEQVAAKERLMKAVNKAYREKLIESFNALNTYRKEPLEKGIQDRMLKSVLLGIISVEDTPEAHEMIIKHFRKATTPTDRVTALIALNRSSSPRRREILEEVYRAWSGHLSGYSNYLRVIPGGTNPDVWEMIEREKKRKGFDITQPSYTRSLLIPMAFNTKMVWTDRGIRWVTETVNEFSKINTVVASRLLSTFQLVNDMKPELQKKVKKQLDVILKRCKDNPTLAGQAGVYLKKH